MITKHWNFRKPGMFGGLLNGLKAIFNMITKHSESWITCTWHCGKKLQYFRKLAESDFVHQCILCIEASLNRVLFPLLTVWSVASSIMCEILTNAILALFRFLIGFFYKSIFFSPWIFSCFYCIFLYIKLPVQCLLLKFHLQKAAINIKKFERQQLKKEEETNK